MSRVVGYLRLSTYAINAFKSSAGRSMGGNRATPAMAMAEWGFIFAVGCLKRSASWSGENFAFTPTRAGAAPRRWFSLSRPAGPPASHLQRPKMRKKALARMACERIRVLRSSASPVAGPLPSRADANTGCADRGHKREHHECVRSHCCRPFPRTSFDAFIQKGERKNGQHKKSRNYKHSDDCGRPMPVLQPLKDGQVIPFWPRYILSIRSFAKEKNMGGHKRENKSRNQKNVGDEKSRDGKSPHLGAPAHQARNALTNPRHFADGGRWQNKLSGPTGANNP